MISSKASSTKLSAKRSSQPLQSAQSNLSSNRSAVEIRPLVVGTRKSPLAMWQAQHIIDLLKSKFPYLECPIETIVSEGDTFLRTALSKFSSKGIFTKELDRALLSHQIDIAVHSLKDLPTVLPRGLRVGCIVKRGTTNDALVLNSKSSYKSLKELPEGSIVGTSSNRRKALLAKHYPHLRSIDIRGNINTRLEKLDKGECDGLILAATGLERLGFQHRITQMLELKEFPYAVSQGALVVICRIEDERAHEFVSALNDKSTMLTCMAERGLLRTLEGGCKIPIGTRTEYNSETFEMKLYGCVVSMDGKNHVSSTVGSRVESILHADRLGSEVAKRIIKGGGQTILDEIRQHL